MNVGADYTDEVGKASLVTVQQMYHNQFLAGIVQRSRDAIIRGQNLADTLRVNGAFMPLLATMTAVGEETGNIDEVMREVSDFHKSQLSALIRTLSAWATPAIVIAVGSIVVDSIVVDSIVGYVYIAFFLTLFSVAR